MDFIRCYNPRNRHEAYGDVGREERTGRPLVQLRLRGDHRARQASLDIFWLKDKSLTDLDDLPEPEDLAAEIIEYLEAGLESSSQGS